MPPAELLRGLASLVYPAHCRSCGAGMGRDGGFFCPDCMRSVRRIDGCYCVVCGLPFQDGSGGARLCSACAKEPPLFGHARAPYVYGGAVKDAIHLYKYGGMRAMEGFLCAGFEGRLQEWFGEVGVVAAVPLHPRRLGGRGFNQSLLLARSAARMLGAGLSLDGLVRTRNTRPQVELGPGEREENVKGAFAASMPGEFAGRRVLLVDDVYTTGATVRECSRVLKKAGAREVLVLTVARAIE